MQYCDSVCETPMGGEAPLSHFSDAQPASPLHDEPLFSSWALVLLPVALATLTLFALHG